METSRGRQCCQVRTYKNIKPVQNNFCAQVQQREGGGGGEEGGEDPEGAAGEEPAGGTGGSGQEVTAPPLWES